MITLPRKRRIWERLSLVEYKMKYTKWDRPKVFIRIRHHNYESLKLVIVLLRVWSIVNSAFDYAKNLRLRPSIRDVIEYFRWKTLGNN